MSEYTLSDRSGEIQSSATLELNAKADEIKKGGEEVINMSVGQPDFEPPKHIREAVAKVTVGEEEDIKGEGKYTPVPGLQPLKEAVADSFDRDFNVSYEPKEVLTAAGAKPLLAAALFALTNPGDDVMVASPYWVSYPALISIAGANMVTVEAREEDRFELKADALKEAVTDKTKVLILNTPSNPTGGIVSKEEQERIAEFCLSNGIWVINDQIYGRLTYEDPHTCIAGISDDIKARTVNIDGASKTYAIPGYRMGWSTAPDDITNAMKKFLAHEMGNAPRPIQHAAIAALTGPQDDVEKMRQEYQRRRDLFVEGLNAIDGISCAKPGGAFYLYPNMSAHYNDEITDSVAMSNYLLDNARIAAVPGKDFGTDEHVRFSFATSEEQIQKCLEKLRGLFG